MMRLIIAVMFIGLLCISTTVTEAQSTFSRESAWKPVSSYSDMLGYQLAVEISMMRNDLEYFSKQSDPKSQRLAIEAKSRLNVLFQLYAQRTGRSLESVREQYGYPAGR